MNVAFFLTPKGNVIYETPDSTMRQALERMEYHRYTSIPLIDAVGRYVGTLTEGDMLWKMKNTPGLSFHETHKVLIKDIPRHMNNKPVSIDADIEDSLAVAATQNFVPVIDDSEVFIGIIKRSEIINYCHQLLMDRIQKK